MCSLRASTSPTGLSYPSPAPWLLRVLDIFSLCSALLYVSAPSGQIFPLQLWPLPQDLPLSSYLLPELLCQHMALVPIWNAAQTHFLGPGPAPALSCPTLVGIPTVAPILPVNPTGSPPEPQHSSAFNSLDPPSFLPIPPTSASLVLPGEAQLNHPPLWAKGSTSQQGGSGQVVIWAESCLTSLESICKATLLLKIPVIFKRP